MSGNDDVLWAMFIDDDPVDQMLYERIAKRSHANLHITSHYYADEALAEIRKDVAKLPDLIFLDLNIPRMSGMEFLAELAKFDEEVRDRLYVVLASTTVNPDDGEVARFPMVKSVLTKPVSVEQLKSLIDQISASKSTDSTDAE